MSSDFTTLATGLNFGEHYSVLGGRTITELDAQGGKVKTNVYAGSTIVAEQQLSQVVWKYANPVTGTQVSAGADGGMQKREYDPFGLELGFADPYLQAAEADYAHLSGGSFYRSGGNPFDADGGCEWNGMPIRCDQISFIARSQQGVRFVTNERLANSASGGTGSGGGFIGFDVVLTTKNIDVSTTPFTVTVLSRELLGTIYLFVPGIQTQTRLIDGRNANFSTSERRILQSAQNRILENDCERWINEQLDKLAKQKNLGQLKPGDVLHNHGATTLRGLLNQARFNKFSINLTAEQMQTHELDRQVLAEREGAVAVTTQTYSILDTARYRQIYLYDKAFERVGRYGRLNPFSSAISVDTASHIVHELFHVAGYSDQLIDNKAFAAGIRKHCALAGTQFGKFGL